MNLSDGGEGETGMVKTKKTRRLLSERAYAQNAAMSDEERRTKSDRLSASHHDRIMRRPLEESARISKMLRTNAAKTNAEKLRIAEKKRQTILGKSDEEKLRIAAKKRASMLRTVALRTRADKNATANNIRDGWRRRLINQ